ncbi:MAG TPA: 3-isopropylmalate dehydrogenase [Actinomycetota bacterium]|nr:3-isopropylmalate dehydrogenase [Actinomycetota bacterium]
MENHSLAVVPGDGIGPEVIDGALMALDAVAHAEGFALEVTNYELGANRYLKSGQVLTDDDLQRLSEHEAVLLGAVGDPRVPPGILEKGLLLRLRRELDLYVNLRPARLLSGVNSVLTNADQLDVVIVRENTEGLYCGKGEVTGGGTAAEQATEVSLNTWLAVSRIVRYGFELAAKRSQSLTLVHKTNVLERAGGLYQRAMKEIGVEFPKVETAYQHIDAAALLLVTQPKRFQVVVTDNLFGDILSDLAAGLVGGIGFVGSANMHPGRVSMFEPVHGSAPDIAGTGLANPVGAILSAAMMLRHLGEEKGATRLERAVEAVAAKIGPDHLTTRETSELIAEAAA